MPDEQLLDPGVGDAGAPSPDPEPKKKAAQPIDYSLSSDGPASRLIREAVADARSNTARQDRDRADWHALLMYRGGESQWSIWDKTTQRYVQRGTNPEDGGLPDYVPRPVTNIFGKNVDGIVALLNQSEPAKEFTPTTDDDRDIATAEVAKGVLPVLEQEIGYADDVKPRTNLLVTLTDKVFWVPYYDTDAKYGTATIPDYQCQTCGQTYDAEAGEDEAGNVLPCDQPDPATGQPCGGDLGIHLDPMTGEVIGDEQPIGKMCVEVVPSFEGSMPKASRIPDARPNPWILFHTRMEPEYIRRTWKLGAEALKNMPKGAKSASGLSRHFADAMTMLSSPARARHQQFAATGTNPNPVVYRIFHDPIVNDEYYYPNGLYAVMMDDQMLWASELPLKDDDGRYLKPVIIRQYANAPGTVFGKPPSDDLIPIQISRNTVEALTQLILMHDAAPTMYIPLTVTLENQPTGAPGETVFYRSLVPGDKPSKSQGMNPTSALYEHMELLDKKAEEISKMNGILQGQRPEGDPTLGEIERLQENGLAAFKTPLQNQSKAEAELARMLLFISKRSLWYPRYRQVRGENSEWEIHAFSGADLTGSVDVRIDSATAWPKSPTMTRMRLKEAFEMGLFPPPAQDPELASKILTMYDLVSLKPSMDEDRKQIARVLSTWKQAVSPEEIKPPDPITQNIKAHRFFLGNWLKTEEFEGLEAKNAPVAQAIRGHIQQLDQLQAQSQMASVAAQAPPDGRTPAEKGDHSALNHAVHSGALVPADAAAPQSPMDALVHSGTLTPTDPNAAPAPPPAAAAPVTPHGPTGPSVDAMTAARARAPLATPEPPV